MKETPRERRYEKNKQMILDVAQKLIAKKGYENVSLREIARKADYSPAGLYEYFDSKDHILASLRERINALLIKTVRSLPESGSAQKQFVAMSLAYVRFAEEYTEYFNLINSLPPLRILQESPDLNASPFAVFQEVVQALLEELALATPPGYGPEEITYSFWTMVHGMATLRVTHMQGFDADFENTNRRILKIFISGLEIELKGK